MEDEESDDAAVAFLSVPAERVRRAGELESGGDPNGDRLRLPLATALLPLTAPGKGERCGAAAAAGDLGEAGQACVGVDSSSPGGSACGTTTHSAVLAREPGLLMAPAPLAASCTGEGGPEADDAAASASARARSAAGVGACWLFGRPITVTPASGPLSRPNTLSTPAISPLRAFISSRAEASQDNTSFPMGSSPMRLLWSY